MKTLVAMVIYPPEQRFPEERRYASRFHPSNPNDEPECHTLAFDHHQWEVEDWAFPEIGKSCACGKVKYQGEKPT